MNKDLNQFSYEEKLKKIERKVHWGGRAHNRCIKLCTVWKR